MKKTLLYVTAGLFIFSAISCTDEVLVNEHEGLRISGGIAPESRTTFIQDGEWTHTHWMANDGIGLYATGQENLPYKAVSNGNYSEFAPSSVNTLTAEQGKKVRAYYPYSDKASGNNVPLPYTIGQSSEKPAAAFMYSEATINNNSLNWRCTTIFW